MKNAVHLLASKKGCRKSCFPGFRPGSLAEEFLDTDCLLKLDYGNLVLRRQAHLFLGCGVLASTALLLFFWLLIINWDFIASGQGVSGRAVPGDTYETLTTMIAFAAPPSAPESGKARAVTLPAAPFTVGKIVKVRQEEVIAAQPAATQSELKELNRNEEAQGAQSTSGSGIGSGIGSGKGGESSGLEGFGEDGTIFGRCEVMPAFLEQKKPRYPEAARIAGITARLFVKVLIGADGSPLKAMIIKRIPEECNAFDAVTLQSVLESTYTPAVQNGRAVKVWCIISVSFRIDDH